MPVVAVIVAILLVGAIVSVLLYQHHTTSSAGPPDGQRTAPPVVPTTSFVTTTVTPPPAPRQGSGREQAQAVESVIAQSIRDHGDLNAAITDIKACKDAPSAATRVRTVVADRRLGIRSAQTLVVSKLNNGPTLRTLLIKVMEDNLNADSVWVDWADQGCAHGRPNPTYATAMNITAEQDKTAFLNAWAPVAYQFKLIMPPPPDEAGSL